MPHCMFFFYSHKHRWETLVEILCVWTRVHTFSVKYINGNFHLSSCFPWFHHPASSLTFSSDTKQKHDLSNIFEMCFFVFLVLSVALNLRSSPHGKAWFTGFVVAERINTCAIDRGVTMPSPTVSSVKHFGSCSRIVVIITPLYVSCLSSGNDFGGERCSPWIR